NINRFVLQECGDFTWRVSDCWCHLRKHLGINATNYFMYQWGGECAPHPSELLHLNQASIQHFIGYLTDAHAGTL
ncbi:MAG: hypothetical protein NZ867_03520, partial [SAR324 cluster bacterium]|nr:hypothetical protein [SAR324 cluster bacterium]